MDKLARQIRIEKWKGIPDKFPSRARTRTQVRARTLGCVSNIIFKRTNGLDRAYRASYKVTGDPVRLEFKDLFLREHDNHQNEGDIELGIDFLREYAVNVWCVVS